MEYSNISKQIKGQKRVDIRIKYKVNRAPNPQTNINMSFRMQISV